MESLARLKIHRQPFHLSFTNTSSSFPKQSSTFRPLIRPDTSFRYPSLKASSSSSQNSIIPLQKSSPFRFLKSACITLATAAALLSFNLHLKPPAIAAPLSTESNGHVTWEEEERALEEHLTTHPTDVDSLRSLVEVKFGSYKLPEAIKLINRLIKLEPDEPNWPVKKARYFTCIGDTESAKTVLEKVLAKDPLRAEAYHALVVAYSNARRDWKHVERRVEEAMLRCERESKRKEYRGFKHLVAQIRVVRGKHAEALKLYEELVEDEPSDIWPYFCQGAIYTLLKKDDKAEEQYLKFKKPVPEDYNYMEDFLVNNLFAGEVFSAMETRSGEFNVGLGGGGSES